MGLVSRVIDEYDAREKRLMQQQEIDQRNTQISLKLSQEGYRRDGSGGVEQVEGGKADIEQQELLLLSRRIANTEKSLMLADLDGAIQSYINSGDVDDIQRAFNNNDKLREIWKGRGVEGVSNIDWERDTDLLKKAGFPDETYSSDESRELLSKEYFKSFDGKNYSISSAEDIMIETGLLKRLSVKKQNILLNHFSNVAKSTYNDVFNRKIDTISEAKNISRGQAVDIIMKVSGEDEVSSAWREKTQAKADANDITFDEQVLREDKRKQKISKSKEDEPTTYQRNFAYKAKLAGLTEKELDQRDRDDELESRITNQDKNYSSELKHSGLTEEAFNKRRRDDVERGLKTREQFVTSVASRKQTEVKGYKKELFELFGGEDEYYATDFSIDKNFRKANFLVHSIEQVGGSKISAADAKDYKEISEMIELGKSAAGGLTEDTTGLVDSYLHEFKQYFFGTVEGIEATSSYQAFKNVLGNSLFGASFTSNESEKLDKAFGVLGNKLGPVLAKFKTSINQVRAKLNAIKRLNNPIVVKLRLGVSLNKLDSIIDGLDQRLEYIDLKINKGAIINKPSGSTIDFKKLKFIIP